jgi:hypothetical protein
MTEPAMDQAIKDALRLHQTVGQTSLDTAYTELQQAIRAFEQEGYPLESIIPGQADGQGFALARADGRSFFDIYARLIRNNLCGNDGQFNKLVKSGVNTSVGAILTAIVTTLGIPTVAFGIMIPIAVIIANTGIDAFCEWTADKG